MAPEDHPRPEQPPPDLSRNLSEALYAEFLMLHPEGGTRELEALCAAHPAEAEELRALHDVRQLLDLAAPADPTCAPGVPGFTCLRLLGRGGMGEVWEAIDDALDRRVALKLQPQQQGQRPRDAERWRREVLATGRVHHPNAVALYSAGEAGGRRFLVQELIAGGRTLRDEIEELRRAGQVPAGHDRRSAERFARLADALQTAHEAGVVHRDVKPQNILLEPDGRPKLADFGLAKLSDSASLSRSGDFAGTYLYASPEQLGHQGGPVGPPSDVFSLGVTLYECLTLERPFAGDDVRSIVQHVLRDDPPDPRSLRTRIPLELALITLKALEKRPERRYASAGALRDDLLRFLGNEPIHARRPSSLRRVQKWITRHPTASATASLFSAAFVLILAMYLESQERARELAQANALLLSTNLELEQARDRARSEADISAEVEGFLTSLLGAADPDLFGTGNPDLRQLVAEGTRRVQAGEIGDPRVRARLTTQLGQLQARLGAWEAAYRLLRESVDLWSELGEDDTPPAQEARCELGRVLADLRDDGQAEALLAPLIERWHRDQGLDPRIALTALVQMAASLQWTGRVEEAGTLLTEAQELLATFPVFPAPGSADPVQARSVDVALAQNAFLAGRIERCAALLDPACESLASVLPAGNTVAMEAFNLQGLLRQAEGRLPEAAALLERLLAIAQDRLGPAHPRAINVRTNLATVWLGMGRIDEAEELLLGNARLADEVLGEGSRGSLSILINLGSLLTFRGELEAAEATLERAIELSLEHGGPDSVDAVMARSALAICYFRGGRPAEAAELQAFVLGSLPEDFVERARMEQALATYRQAAGTTAR